jgi:hypothetical protein
MKRRKLLLGKETVKCLTCDALRVAAGGTRTMTADATCRPPTDRGDCLAG